MWDFIALKVIFDSAETILGFRFSLGFQALKDLGIDVGFYCTSEIDEQAIQVQTW